MSESAQRIFDLAQARMPLSLRPLAEHHWRNFREHLPELPPVGAERWLAAIPRVFAASDFVARACAQYPRELGAFIESGELFHPYAPGELARRVAHTLADAADETALKHRLRVLRRREMVRIAFRDLAGWAELPEVMATLSELADACLDQALVHLQRWLEAPPGFVVLGLGKLGGGELNFSSDIDLVFAYADDGDAAGTSHHERFVRLAQRLIQALAEPTADGFVFRVDMRLRPHGASGPLAVSFDTMENYYQVHGREWERYAFIKARVVAGDRAAGAELLQRLKPFVFRKYLDYGAIESLRAMKALIEREVLRKGMEANIKLGPGGIREIEFIAQALQLIRGGREPPLQERALLPVLDRLVAAGHLESTARDALHAAYVFLRNAEHRLQMVADAQTHDLPADELGWGRLAYAMNSSSRAAFETALTRHRRKVQEQFSLMFRVPHGEAAAEEVSELVGVWLVPDDHEKSADLLRAAGYREPENVLAMLRDLREGSAYEAMSAEGQARLDRLVPLLLVAAALTRAPETTVTRLVGLLEDVGRRTSYFALLIENPMALSQLVKLCAASPWIAGWIARHPIVLDELLDPRALHTPLMYAALAEELHARLAAVSVDDIELQMELLREFHHSHLLRIAATDLGPGLAAERTGAHLADLAEVVIGESLALAAAALVKRHGEPVCRRHGESYRPGFAVIGYGKLGSRELGYASDLDMIFLYEGCEEGVTNGARAVSNEEFFARLGQRLIHFLTTRTPGGVLYEVDMRLRPSGQSGPLVASIAAFRKYQKAHAWTWEHQALVRARAVAGESRLCAAFEEVRHEILCRPRDPERLRAEVREMRRKMAATHAADAAGFNVKHDRGGIVDIEFMVQYAVLRWAHAHPALARHPDNIGILEALAAEGLLDAAKACTLIEAYRRYLSAEHRLKLMERGSTVDRATLDGLPEQVAQIWDEMFEKSKGE
ncbi:MAG: bifunctional [glutamate--ammonia ligase]-adenylyl-L-tyrosine phosphorylase/[glutamate--ammonia-ligase] adenylyltransferase [Gammaproteobacteria bacterium]|nr:bifunctional [glutamate--ammonia ligase]-adenylyl-L-tyrosine phosphorylase/[glutamate--ammonia-ligase] adenylyltransferase [Gammaproteobacteria bacterium]